MLTDTLFAAGAVLIVLAVILFVRGVRRRWSFAALALVLAVASCAAAIVGYRPDCREEQFQHLMAACLDGQADQCNAFRSTAYQCDEMERLRDISFRGLAGP